MKFEECKIAIEVKPKSGIIETISATDKNNHWTPRTKNFFIARLNHLTKTVMIKTTDPLIPEGYDFVDPSCLTRTNPDKFSMSDALHGKPITRPQTPDYKLDFEVRREKNELSAYYHGIKLATVRCHPDDTYDEEFGLHLLLRRACLKLKDEHTVVETVEELLQKP